MKWERKKVLVIGTGISGIGAAKLLHTIHAVPYLFDANIQAEKEKIRKKLPEDMQAEIFLGSIPKEIEESIELVVLSPGVAIDSPLVERFRAGGIEIWGEIELAYHFARGDILAITGTNGKTTTTALLGRIMQDVRQSVYVAGNIGNPYTLIAQETNKDSVTVAEISSFQLESIHSFRPKISAILNITPDHLNRHHTMEAYIAVKERIAVNQCETDTCVLNYDDPHTRAFVNRTKARVVFFSSAHKLTKGFYLQEEAIYLADGDNIPQRLMKLSDMRLIGRHNAENVMAAIAMAYSYGIALADIVESVKQFKAVEHRIEFVAEKKGVAYYNDSKGTNPDAAIKGIQAMKRPTLLIGGGYDKQNSYDAWIEAFDGKVKWLVLIGQTKEAIARCALEHGFQQIIMAESLEEAMELCVRKAEQGDAVLLSPACASWGMFPNYEVRGECFKKMVNEMEE